MSFGTQDFLDTTKFLGLVSLGTQICVTFFVAEGAQLLTLISTLFGCVLSLSLHI